MEGSKQQQVTGFPFSDVNNQWEVVHLSRDNNFDEPQYLLDKDYVLFRHLETKTLLHSHWVPAPLSKGDNEVSAYTDTPDGDVNDIWRIEVMSGGGANGRINAITTRFRLRHVYTNCTLRYTRNLLPKWANKQREVTCKKKTSGSYDQIWNFEIHINPQLPIRTGELPKSGFLNNVIHLNTMMIDSNNGLTVDDAKPDPSASSPLTWPILSNGIRITIWSDEATKVYLVGNPFVWWSCLFCLIVSIPLLFIHQITQSRGVGFISPEEYSNFGLNSLILLGGYLLHFIPSLIMDRVTYLHHYLPALLFGILNFGLLLDHFFLCEKRLFRSRMFSTKFRVFWSVMLLLLFFYPFFRLYPVAYGFNGTVEEMAKFMWLDSWNIV